jgi:predicted nucleic acid-binding protein
MTERAFVDSSILVYAHDRGAGARHEVARDLVLELWRECAGVISTQVLHETYVNLRRKAARPLSIAEARGLLQDYLEWDLVVVDGATIVEATHLEERYGLAFWDALIVSAANFSGVQTLFTEDLNHGQRYGQVEARDPFRG